MADDRIEVEIILDDGSIQKGFAKLRSEAKTSERSIGRIFRRGLTRDISRPFDVATKSIFNLRNALVGAVAVLGGGAFLRTITQAASQQQDAVNALNVSLATAGTFSDQASESFQRLAAQLQSQSRFGDEVILQQAALARNYARSNEEAEKLISVSIDLAEATGTSLDSAVRNLGKTFSGLQGEIGESVPAIRALTAEQLKAGAALDLIADRFGGAALGATRTFSGALAQLQNTFGDLLEQIGSAITSSPIIVNVFNSLSKAIQGLGEGLAGGNIDAFLKDLVINSASAVNAIIDSFELVTQIPDFFRFVFLTVQIETSKFVQRWLAAIEPVSSLADTLLGRTGESQQILAQNFKAIDQLENKLANLGKESIKGSKGFFTARKAVEEFVTSFQELSATTRQSAAPANSPVAGIVEAVDKDLVNLREKVMKLQGETRSAIENSFFNSESVLAGTPTVFQDLSQLGTEALQKLQGELVKTRDKTVQLSQQIGQAVNNGIANTIANSVSSVVEALRTGQNAFGAFAKAALATIGDLAVQLGQTLIASGIGIEALKVLGGAAAIAAGIALVAVGSLIKGASGGGAPNPSGGSSVTPPLADLTPGGISDNFNEPGSRVNVTIEGNVFDSDETGLRIADILKDQGFQNAVVT